MKARRIILLSLLFSVLLINRVSAQVDFTEFDDRLGDALGVGSFGGGLLATILLLFLIFGLLGIVTKRKPGFLITLMVGISVFSFAIAATWFPVWTLVIIILLIAFGFAGSVVKKVR